jgi:YbgC/YbaW family acyl-CoA thioester hydrolase
MTTQRTEFRFLDRQRVRWAEVDMQKIVFNGHYLMYFDTAVAGYWRALAMPYAATMAYPGGDLFVREATVEYEGSAPAMTTCSMSVNSAATRPSQKSAWCAPANRSSSVVALSMS